MELPVLVPPDGEQSEILKFIGCEMKRLDELRAEAERAIALFKERRSTLIAAAVTGQIDVRNSFESKTPISEAAAFMVANQS